MILAQRKKVRTEGLSVVIDNVFVVINMFVMMVMISRKDLCVMVMEMSRNNLCVMMVGIHMDWVGINMIWKGGKRLYMMMMGIYVVMMRSNCIYVVMIYVVMMAINMVMKCFQMMVIVVMEGWTIMSTGSSVEMKSFRMDNVQWLMSVNQGFVVVVINVDMSRGINMMGHRYLVQMMDMVFLMGRNPAWRWLRNWHPLLNLHRTPSLPPVRYVDSLGQPSLHPSRLPVDFLSPESIRCVLHTNNPARNY